MGPLQQPLPAPGDLTLGNAAGSSKRSPTIDRSGVGFVQARHLGLAVNIVNPKDAGPGR
jgi:hypothetical protein